MIILHCALPFWPPNWLWLWLLGVLANATLSYQMADKLQFFLYLICLKKTSNETGNDGWLVWKFQCFRLALRVVVVANGLPSCFVVFVLAEDGNMFPLTSHWRLSQQNPPNWLHFNDPMNTWMDGWIGPQEDMSDCHFPPNVKSGSIKNIKKKPGTEQVSGSRGRKCKIMRLWIFS